MAVETVADILPVRDALHDSVLRPELLYLQAAEILRRCTVDRIKVSIFLFKTVDFFIDIFKHLYRKCAVLHKRLAVVEHLQLIECRDAKGSCRIF